MNNININTIEDLSRSNNLEEIRLLLLKTLNYYNLNDFGYAVQLPSIVKKEHPYIFTGYHKEWVDHYTSNAYYNIDPTILYSANNIAPIAWSDKLFLNCNNFRNESTDAGLAHGITYPIHGMQGEKGLFCIAGKEPICQEAYLVINSLVSFLHNQIMNVDLKNNTYFKLPTLTIREKEYLQWLAIGKNMEEIAIIMNISYRTAVDYGEKLKKKFKCNSKQQVLTTVLMKKMITL